MSPDSATDTSTIDAPTTDAPTTEAPTTDTPTIDAPTTDTPTIEAPITEAPPLRQLKFANSNVANLVTAPADASVAALLKSLEVKSCDFILLPLGASPELPSAADALQEKLARPLLQVLASLGRSVVIDSGIRSWLTAPLYQHKATKASQVSFLGVAPESLVTYPNKTDPADSAKPQRQLDSWHSAFVLVESDGQWGVQLPMLHAVVRELTSRSAQVPVLALLAGDGLGAAEEALAAVRQGIPLAVVQGSGKLADDIVAVLTSDNAKPAIEVTGKIIAEGQITIISQANFLVEFARLTSQVQEPDEVLTPAEFARLTGQVEEPDKVLTQAWENFAIYDLNAQYQQRRSDRITLGIIGLGVFGTVLAISKQVVYGSEPYNLAFTSITQRNYGGWLLHISLLVIPILLTILIAAAYKFKMSSKWFVLRAGAEALKGEIYTYRTRALDYQNNAAPRLAARMAEIMKRTMQSEANASHLEEYNKENGFPPYMDGAGGGDSGFGYLSPERYADVRLDDQLRYFRKRTRSLDRQFQWLYWLTLLIGGAGTLLAAIRQEVWIAVTGSLAAAVGALLNYRQIETNLLKFNQATADLDNIKSWWKALSVTEKSRQSNIDTLVDRTEKVLQTELDGWVQQMKNALAELEKTQAQTVEKAQKWRPAVRFVAPEGKKVPKQANAVAAKARTAANAAAAAAETQRPQTPAPVATSESSTPTANNAPAAADSAPAAKVEVTASVQPATKSAEATASVLPAALKVEVKVNGLATNDTPHNHKPVWDSKEITAAVLKDTIKNKGYKWFDNDLNIIGIRTTHYHNNTFEDRIFCCWKQPDFPSGSSLLQKQQFLIDWAYKGKDGAPIQADNVEGINTRIALNQLTLDAGKERVLHWAVTTRPGTKSLDKRHMKVGGCAVVVPGQYVDAYELGIHKASDPNPKKRQKALVQRGELEIYRDADGNATANEAGSGKKERDKNFGINIHHALEDTWAVEDWSAGCQVFKRIVDHTEFLLICQKFGTYENHKRFGYTLLHEADLVS